MFDETCTLQVCIIGDEIGYLIRFGQNSTIIRKLHKCEVISKTDVSHDILNCSTTTFRHPIIEHPRLRLHSISCHISSGDYLSFVYSVNRWPATFVRTISVRFYFGVCFTQQRFRLTPRSLFRQIEPCIQSLTKTLQILVICEESNTL